MFGRILYISDNTAEVENISKGNISADLMNVHVIFESNDQRILGEVTEVNDETMKIRFLGEYLGERYVNGIMRKPLLSSKIRVINGTELLELVGKPTNKSFTLGKSAVYKNYTIYPDINDFFSSHLAIFGNSGSGKSCGVSRIIQNIFADPNVPSFKANLFFFDAYGEYKNAFSAINKYNEKYLYKFITTKKEDETDELLQIPTHLLTLDDWALMLQASKHSQLPIIERTIKLAKIFAKDTEEAKVYKNHLIAKALLAVLFSSETTALKKNEIFTIIEVCNTPEFNFGSVIPGLGYTRTFSECFEIDSSGYFGESVLITNYILSFIKDDIENIQIPDDSFYTIKDFAKALEFTLISEGFQNNENLYADAIILKVRLNSIITSKVGSYFEGNKYTPVPEFIERLTKVGNKKAQIININLEDIDDVYAKVIVKIFSRLLFEYSKARKDRAQDPYHLFLEEAHRYIQKDTDTFLIGYNIFDRIAKEGRKYGVILDIISQRPVEISDTVIAQCSNFLIFKMTHPLDIKYIEEMLPNISADVIAKQKVLQPGSCVGFGAAFKIPMIIKLDMPNPTPSSSSCDVSACWSQVPNEDSVPEQSGDTSVSMHTPGFATPPMAS